MLKTDKQSKRNLKQNYMIKVRVTFLVKRNSTQREELETTVDRATLSLASGQSSREQLSDWAKTFFPGCEWAKVTSMTEIND